MKTLIDLKAPARLHLGFLDLNGSQGRKFGSLGVAIRSHYTRVSGEFCERDDLTAVPTHLTSKVTHLIRHFRTTFSQQIGNPKPIKLSLPVLIPEHIGLGSGTQLALAIGTVLAKLYQIELSAENIASIYHRGARSGIGIAAFEQGGFIVDAGKSAKTATPPVLMRFPFPDTWRIVLLLDNAHQGLHDKAETQAFKTLPPFPLTQVASICQLTLMQLVPGILERDINTFGGALNRIQTMIGDHFSPAQGGRYTSKGISRLLDQAAQLGYSGLAQSSWGPTACVFVENDYAAKQLADSLKATIIEQLDPSRYSVIITEAQNHGALVE